MIWVDLELIWGSTVVFVWLIWGWSGVGLGINSCFLVGVDLGVIWVDLG